MSGWRAWRLDGFTWSWIVWMVWFGVFETAALWLRNGQELTAHLRPVLQSGSDWSAWRLDGFTWAWIAWLGAFVVLETWALAQGRGQELTAHLRPVFQSAGALMPPWYIGVGLWAWMFVHFFVDGVDRSGVLSPAWYIGALLWLWTFVHFFVDHLFVNRDDRRHISHL